MEKENGHGGKRKGAGRPVGSGTGPSEDGRYSRVAVMLSKRELAKLKKLARTKGVPVATAAYDIVSRSLRRAK